MSTVDSSGVNFWDGSAWINLDKGPKGAVGLQGDPGVDVVPVQSLGSYNLDIDGSTSGVPINTWKKLGSSGERADTVNNVVTAQGDDWKFNSPGAFLVTMFFQIGVPASTARYTLAIWKLRADGSETEIARRTIGVMETGGTVTGVFLVTDPTDKMSLKVFNTADAGQFNAWMQIAPIGPLTLTPQVVQHADYTSGGTKVNTYTITPTLDAPPTGWLYPSNGILTNDWMYIIHEHYWEVASLDPTFPPGWEVVVPLQNAGAQDSGIQWGIWRKKRAAGETGYTITLGGDRFVRASMIVVRQPNDNLPTLSPYTPQRAALNPSVNTILTDGITVPDGGLVIAISLQNTASQYFRPPPTMGGARAYWYTVPTVDTYTHFAVAVQQIGPSAVVDATTFSWPFPDAGRVGGVALVFS